MKWSKFNFIFQHEDNEYILYNSLTNSIIQLSENEFNYLKSLSETDSLSSKKISPDLISAKVFVQSDKEEVEKIINYRKKNRKQKILDLYIYPTLECNFSCSYCYQRDMDKTSMNINTANLSIQFIISKIKEVSPKGISITWIGGEPLLKPELIIYIYEKLIENIIALGLNIQIDNMLATNGYLIDKAHKIGFFQKLNISLVQITIDGLENIHNIRRRLLDSTSFQTILSNIDILYKNYPNLKIAIRCNVDKKNKLDFPVFFRFLTERYPSKNIRIIPAFVENYSFSACNLCPDILSKKEQGDFYLELFKNYGIICTDFHPKLSTYSCMAKVDNSLAIGPDGSIYKCATLVGKKEYSLFHLENTKRINTKFLDDFLTSCDFLNIEECLACRLFPICDGGCSILRLKENSFNVVTDNCHIAKYNLEEFIKSHIFLKKQLNHER